MRIVHKTDRGDRIVEIDIDDPSCPASALLDLLGIDAVSELKVDGRVVAVDSPLSAAHLCEGSLLEASPSDVTTADPTPSARALTIVGGVRAGVAVSADGAVSVGRSAGAGLAIDDATLSLRHLTVEGSGASLVDHGSRNGTSIEGHPVLEPAALAPGRVIRAGTTRLMVRDVVTDVPVAVASALGAKGGTIPFNRPPRQAPQAEMPPLVAPGLKPTRPITEPLSVAGIVLPIIAGAVMAMVFSPFMAIFAALGPVLTIGTWWERRRRARREYRADQARFEADMADLAAALPGARVAEIKRRRALHPDPAEVVRRATGPSVSVWQRRPGDPDCFVVGVGADDEPFRPRLVARDGDAVAVETGRMLASVPAMPDVPVALDLGPGRTVGIVGDRAASLAIARSLVLQMATHHGPADLAIVVAADEPRRWRWCAWLPHTADHASGRLGVTILATDDSRDGEAVRGMQGERLLLAVLDGHDPFQGRTTVGRILSSSERLSSIVLVPDEHRLPASCDVVVRSDELGRITLVDPCQANPGRTALGWGIGSALAQRTARRLARLDDPELPVAGAGVPSTAPLLGLLGIDGDDAAAIERRWRLADGTAALASPIGLDADGVVLLDLVREGPHVLVGGTTGSGKSELLRSLVAGLAASADPDHVAMVLIDYKGGAAFDCCAELPHVAGLVTDLDETLASRALRCLEAELHHREERLRAVGAEDLAAFRRLSSGLSDVEPLPRLVVVVDEFASLAADLPEFLDALVGIAQRGRSLGVHMVLATQRPAGVVTDDIRANTSCRIALRVTDRGDSTDVIDAPDAAAIPRHRPGRAIARFGPGELVPFQSAFATGRSSGRTGVNLAAGSAPREAADGPTDLERLVRAIGAAHRARGGGLPRSPWPPALPELATGAALGALPGQWLLVDEPDQQRQRVDGWLPCDGHLCAIGAPASGVTTTLGVAAIAAVDADPNRHVHVIDFDAGALAALADLPSVGTYCAPSDVIRRSRLLRWLDDEVGRRRADPDLADPPILVVVDDLGGLARAHDPVKEAAVHDRFARVWADGPAVGITMAVGLRRSADLPAALAATVGEVLLHRSADQGDALRFGLSGSTAAFGPGRAVRRSDGALVHVLLPDQSFRDAVECRTLAPATTPHEVGELEPAIARPSNDEFELSVSSCRFTVGLRDRDLRPAVVMLHPGEHFLVVGPARSGRTNALASIGTAAGDQVIVVGSDELAQRIGVASTDPADLERSVGSRGDGALVLVDDCLGVDDPTGTLEFWVQSPPAGVHLVVAARPDRYRAAYGHWASDVKSSRVGVLLRPDPMDGDLLGQQLPVRLGLPPLPGRGVLVVDSMPEVVQIFCDEERDAACDP